MTPPHNEPIARLRDRLSSALSALRDIVGSVEPGAVSGEEALELVNLLGETERAAASGMARLTPRVIETGAFARAGFGSAQDWLAAASGTSSSSARNRLTAAEHAARAPELSRPIREGKLSAPEIGVLAQSALEAPEALGELVELATGTSSFKELSDAASAAKCAARTKESARLRRARVHRTRHLRWRQDEHGGIRGEFLCDEVAWARVAPALESRAKARAKAAGNHDGDSFEAHRLDAFVELLGASARAESKGSSSPHALVVIDAAALQRGSLNQGEHSEIEGIGSVSVEAATELLGEAMARFVIKSGRDVASVTSSTRWIPPSTAAALVVRDRACVVPGCGKRLGLETDHCDVDFADGGPTTLTNLARLCPEHHDMKTHGGWKLVRAKDRWRWLPPDNPPSAERIARARRLAAVRNQRR
jgi:hypothetical protein